MYQDKTAENEYTRRIQNQAAKAIVMDKQTPSATDPNGSYTGIPLEPFTTPIQDADDL